MIVNPFLSSATELLSSKFWILKRNPAIIKHIPNEYIEKKKWWISAKYSGLGYEDQSSLGSEISQNPTINA